MGRMQNNCEENIIFNPKTLAAMKTPAASNGASGQLSYPCAASGGELNLQRLKGPIYNPTLVYAEGFNLSKVFDCRHEMSRYQGDADYHSLMHNVQKLKLTANKVEALSFFANKLLLREWTDGLVPIQKVFGSPVIQYSLEVTHILPSAPWKTFLDHLFSIPSQLF